MKVILAVPVAVFKAVADLLFGTDDVNEAARARRYSAQYLMVMGRTE